MTVANGREILAIPGPTIIPDRVLAAMHRPAIDIYAGTMIGITDSCRTDLARLFSSTGRVYLYAANGHGVWEAALSNVLSRGDRVLVLANGHFAAGWAEMATRLGVEVEPLNGDWRRAFDPAALAERLRADKAGSIKAVLAVQVDTASSVLNDIGALREAMDSVGHDALLMVDAIASLGVVPFEFDAWGVDVAVSASQKGLMSPPGLGFTVASRRALARHQHADLRTFYWDWTERDGPLHYHKYCGTPPEHLLFALREALDMILEEGLPQIYERHRLLAGAVRAAVTSWSKGGAVSLNVEEPAERANSVTTFLADPATLEALRDYCRDRCGVVLGIGIGNLTGKALRIGHMGHVNAPSVLGTLGAVETAMIALGMPLKESGVAAAISHLGRNVPAKAPEPA
jgi:alanine-glyoxylate transaminase / serine-glyoxylate transaminase / serine-pyruvate transaminase